MTTSSRIAKTLEWATAYRRMGYNCLASCPVKGYPPWTYGPARDAGLPAAKFEAQVRRSWTNIQLAAGSKWGFVGVDLDGESGIAAWESLCLFRPVPQTVTGYSPRGGMLLLFAVDGTGPIPSFEANRIAGSHDGIDVIGDGGLVKVAPSVKVVDGKTIPYRWADGLGPGEVPMAPMPPWLLSLRPSRPIPAPAPALAPRAVSAPVAGHYDWDAVLRAIPDKLGLAESWGLRVVSRRQNDRGWINCRSIWRDDNHPSASFHPAEGLYWERGIVQMRLFDLALARGVYPDFPTAVNHLGSVYLARRAS